MVDVGAKIPTKRVAVASGEIYMSAEAFALINENKIKKGPVLQTAVVAAIMGAKKTSDLIPMCHNLNIENVKCEFEPLENGFRLIARVALFGKTGVEMEALTAVSIGLLTVYDMVKAVDKRMNIQNIKLDQKQGGKSGDFNYAN